MLPKDGAWYGRYLVVFADALRIQLKELEYHVLETVADADSVNDKYEVKWGGPAVRFRVFRRVDNVVMKDKFDSKVAAAHWMNQQRT